jgi:signal transduction histidine kinase
VEVERLARLMRELLEYGKPIQSDLTHEAIDTVLRDGLESCAPLAAEKGVLLTTDVPAGLPKVSMDRIRLVQVFQNLIQNAVQHSPRGGAVVVSARREETDGRGALILTIADSGPGFAPEDLAHAFEPFFTRRRGGTGLGLAIVQHIVEAHGGAVGAANRPEGGATLTVTLPAAGGATVPPPA